MSIGKLGVVCSVMDPDLCNSTVQVTLPSAGGKAGPSFNGAGSEGGTG